MTNSLVMASATIAALASGQMEWPHQEYKPKTELAAKEFKDGKLHLRFTQWSPCFAAVYPACPGHTKAWTEVYAVSNGCIVFEKTIDD